MEPIKFVELEFTRHPSDPDDVTLRLRGSQHAILETLRRTGNSLLPRPQPVDRRAVVTAPMAEFDH